MPASYLPYLPDQDFLLPPSQCGRGPDDPPRGGRWKRPFGTPEDKAQENFTDPDSRIMKRACGGFDASYNAQTAVDEAAHIA